MSNGLDTDQDRHDVCPDLGDWVLRLSADDKSINVAVRKELKDTNKESFLFIFTSVVQLHIL